jgi:Tfp pilus assembly protein PilO
MALMPAPAQWGRLLLRRFGRSGLGVLLGLLGLLLALGAWQRQQQANATQLQARIAQSVAQWQKLQAAREAVRRDPVVALLENLPQKSEISAVLFQLQELGAAHQVVLSEADYGFTSAEAPFAGRVRLHFRTQAGYEDLRRLLQAVHEQLPALALTRVGLERKKIGDGRLETSLEFMLYFRGDAP